MADVVVLHKNFNGRESARYFLNWSNAQVAVDKDVTDCMKTFGCGEIREKRSGIKDDIAVYEVYAYFQAIGGCSWYLTEEYFEDR